ncbi:MAG: D-alanyl-D-alanine carboxypeptidase family protein, partial [Christensenellaceae bacterium]
SQVYLEAGGNYEIGELLKSIVVCSANDSCVAMAETTAGSESIFVDRMNERAKELGMNDTLFANCTGLPKEPQYSCAHDVALMLKSLLSHPLYFEYSKIRTETFRHPKDRVTEMTNTNRLIRSYEGCDSGKTGFTNLAGFCLAASAKRGNLRVISVSIGSSTSNDRFDCHRTLLDYAFANYTNRVVADAEATFEERAPVSGGKSDSTAVRVERNVCVFGKKNETADVSFEVRFDKVKAPVACGDKVGTLVVYKDNIEYDSVALVAMEDVARSTIWDEYRKNASEWGL